jgi:hypothetical protein
VAIKQPGGISVIQLKTQAHKTEMKWALIHSLMFLTWMFIEKAAGLHDVRLDIQPFAGVLIMLPSVIIYVLALLDKKNTYLTGKNPDYWQSLASGCMLTLFIVILSPLNNLLVYSFITPDYFANVTEYTVSKGILTPEEAMRQFSISNYIVTSVVAGSIIGIIFSAVISTFTKTRRHTHEQFEKSR